MSFKVGDKVNSVRKGIKLDTGKVAYVLENGNIIVKPDSYNIQFEYTKDGISIDDPDYSVTKMELEQ